MWKKKKDEVSKKREEKKAVPYRRCGHARTYKAPNGSMITVYCQQNANVSHRHD